MRPLVAWTLFSVVLFGLLGVWLVRAWVDSRTPPADAPPSDVPYDSAATLLKFRHAAGVTFVTCDSVACLKTNAAAGTAAFLHEENRTTDGITTTVDTFFGPRGEGYEAVAFHDLTADFQSRCQVVKRIC